MLSHGSTPVNTIWVHQLTTSPDWMSSSSISEKVAEVRSWHKDYGWRDIGYHYVIDRDGAVGAGRRETEVGAHVAGHNTGSIGISLVGGKGASKDSSFLEYFTSQQDAALRDLIADIETRADIKRVRGHCDVANKACPGFDVAAWYAPVTAPEATSEAMAGSSKYKAAQTVKVVSIGAAAVPAGLSVVQGHIETAQTVMGMAQELLATQGLVVVSALCIGVAILMNWMQMKQRGDFESGRYTPSGGA